MKSFKFYFYFTFLLSASAPAQTLQPGQPLALPGKAAKFDFMGVDTKLHRILAAHKGASTLEVIDVKTSLPLKAVPVGDAQGVAVDYAKGKYFLGNDEKHSVSIVDSKTLKNISEVKVDGAVDAITFDSKNGLLYAAQDNGDRLWIIDPGEASVTGTIPIPGVPEVLDFDPTSDKIYLNIKDKNLVVAIDPKLGKVVSSWPTLPATSPHGLVVDSKRGRVYTAGGNGKLVSLDLTSGKVLSSADIPVKVDQISYDPEKQLIYSACKGFVGITRATESGLRTVGTAASPNGAHTLTVDPATHEVWVSYADSNHSYLLKYTLNSDEK